MPSNASNFIKKKKNMLEQASEEKYSTITVRLNPKHAVMLKAISKGLDFPISSSLSEIVSKNIFDYISKLSEESFKEFEIFRRENPIGETYTVHKLMEEGRIEELKKHFNFISKKGNESDEK
jgi:hypothetical protein